MMLGLSIKQLHHHFLSLSLSPLTLCELCLERLAAGRHYNAYITEGVEGLRVGIPREYNAPGLSQEMVCVWQEVVDMLEAGGAEVSSCSLPHTQYSIVCYSVLAACEIASNMARYDGIEYGFRHDSPHQSLEDLVAASRHEGFNDVVRGRILAGNYFLLQDNYERYFSKAQQVRRLICDDFTRVFDEGGVDVLLTPTSLSTPLTHDTFTQLDNRARVETEDVCTQPANLAGLPAVSVPAGESESSRLPLSVQVMGNMFSDQLVLDVASFIETHRNYPHTLDTAHTIQAARDATT